MADASFEKINGWVVVPISPEVNYESSLALKKNIENLCADGEYKIALDLSQVKFVGSLALGIFSYGKKLLANHEGDICILSPNSTIKETLAATQMSKVINIYPNAGSLS